MVIVITILHVIVCLFLILAVLLQAGKGGGMGIAFGGSGSGTVFGGSGAGNFMTRVTAATAMIFMVTSLSLAYFASSKGSDGLRVYSTRARAEAAAKDAEKKKLEEAAAKLDAGTVATPEPKAAEPGTVPSPSEGAAPAPTEPPSPAPAPEKPTEAPTPAPQ